MCTVTVAFTDLPKWSAHFLSRNLTGEQKDSFVPTSTTVNLQKLNPWEQRTRHHARWVMSQGSVVPSTPNEASSYQFPRG
eukprot:1139865-Pelagomonas_calceolata.AAC.4